MSNLYYNKYIKYKSKYNTLKKIQSGGTDEYKINILSYNIDFNNYYKDSNKTNIINFINNNQNQLDIIGLQEATWDISLKNFGKIQNIKDKYISQILYNKHTFKCIDVIGIESTRGINCCRLLHNKSYETFIIINFHLEHWQGTKFHGENNFKKTIDLFNKLLKIIKYKSHEHLILLGDSNEFYDKYNKKNIQLNNNINIIFRDGGKSCCSHSGNQMQHTSDIIGTNEKNGKLTNLQVQLQTKRGYSDHLPLLGQYQFKSTEYSLYLVPYDYNGPVKNTFKKYGGIKPHITLISFYTYNIDKLNEGISKLAKSSQKRWVFGKRNYKIIKNDLTMIQFESKTLYNKLTKLENTLGISEKYSKKNHLHITFGKTQYLMKKEYDNILTIIQKSTDWKIVLVSKISVDKDEYKYKWIKSYDFFD